jgi:hypothetical protein
MRRMRSSGSGSSDFIAQKARSFSPQHQPQNMKSKSYQIVPLDRISRDTKLWLRAIVRLQKAKLIPSPMPDGFRLKLFIRVS